MSFRLDAKSFFLTYPQCPLSKAEVLEELEKKPVSIKYYCIAQELHADGNPHIHVLLLLELKKHTTNPKYFDILGHHGNYQAARSKEKIYDYITKADPEPLSNLAPEDVYGLKTKAVKRAVIAKELIEGAKLSDTVEKYPQILFGLNRLKQDIATYEEEKLEVRNCPDWIPNPWGLLISSKMGCKRRHWWIYSTQPNRGKTTWAKSLKSSFGAHLKSGDFTYWNLSGKESILLLDEYNVAGIRYHQLNQICDGTFEFRVFMAGLRRLEGLRLVIVLSNHSLTDLYPFMANLLLTRFIVKCVD